MNFPNVVTAVASTVIAAALIGLYATQQDMQDIVVQNSTLLSQYIPQVEQNSVANQENSERLTAVETRQLLYHGSAFNPTEERAPYASD